MKAVNVVLSILILLLALVSAAFSYFLFEKRTQFVEGWDMFAKTIEESSRKLSENNSGFQTVKKSELAHSKYDKSAMKKKLAELGKQSSAVIEQRDNMADAFVAISRNVSGSTGNVDEYKDVLSYDGKIRQVKADVASTVRKRDNVYSELNSVVSNGSNNGCYVDVNSLKRGDTSALEPIGSYLRKNETIKAEYRTTLRVIGRKVNANVNVSDDNARAASGIIKALDVRLAQIAELRRQLGSSRQEVAGLQSTVSSKNREIASVKDQLANTERDLKEIKRANGYAEDFKPWRPGSVEARERLQGKVVKIDSDYGYLVVDLGKASTVAQQAGKNKVIPINLELTGGVELAVVRKDGDKTVYVSTIVLDKVGEKESVANIPVKGGKIKVGDDVIYKVSK